MKSTNKLEEFVIVTHEEDDDMPYAIPLSTFGKDIKSYIKNNMEPGEEITLKLITGVRIPDKSGNFEFQVKEVKLSEEGN